MTRAELSKVLVAGHADAQKDGDHYGGWAFSCDGGDLLLRSDATGIVNRFKLRGVLRMVHADGAISLWFRSRRKVRRYVLRAEI